MSRAKTDERFPRALRFIRPERIRFEALEMMGAVGLALLVTARFIPVARWLPWWGCPLRETTGLPCLSCGMTRSFDWLMQGRVIDALLINPLGFALAVMAAIAALYLLLAPLRPPRPHLTLSRRGALLARIGAVVVFFGNWLYLLARTLSAGTA